MHLLERKRKEKRKAILEQFYPYPPHESQTITNYQNEFLGLYDALEGVERGRVGGRTIRWVLIDGLEGNLTPAIMAKEKGLTQSSISVTSIHT